MKALKITWMGQSRRNALGLVEVEQDVKVPLLVLDIAAELADPPSLMSTFSFGTPCPW